ncbi:MAG: glycosyltransferase, partial [Chloroflexi bacterium]|nr:glycosyltransferase [Chloroflexota bacterium]
PVLASDVGGVGELVVHDHTGWLLAPENLEALDDTLALVLSVPTAVASMRPACRRIAEGRVSPAVIATAYRECFARALASRS